jgi:hypothetical protein
MEGLSRRFVKRNLVISLLALVAMQSYCLADMMVQTSQPNRQDRFYVGADKAFLGASFDFSGVGQTGGGTWATMISPTYFVTAAHYHPGSGDVLTFHTDNNPSGPTYQGTVDSWSFQTNYNGTPSDLWLGRLTTPIPASANITYYPVLSLPSQSDYIGQLIYVNGKPNRLGRNNIDTIRVASEPEAGTTHNKSTVSMEYNYDTVNGLGADECFLIGGDSGGPSFIDVGGKLTVVGTHYYDYGTPDVMDWGMISGDSFIPYYISELDAAMVGDQVTVVTPEPATLALLTLGGLAFLRRNRRAL